MSTIDFISLIPVLIIAGAPLLILIIISIFRKYEVVYGITLLSLIISFISIFVILPDIPHNIVPLFTIDYFSLFFSGIILISAFFIVLLSYSYIKQVGGFKEEYYIILLTGTLGAMLLTMASDFILFFLGFETLSISLYVMISFQKAKKLSIEAGIKYLILASASSAFLLFGMALIYTQTGTMEFNTLAIYIKNAGLLSPLIIFGFGMMLVGIGFKLALAPFHMWTPDVYQGSPTPVSAYIATISKGALMAVFIRFFISIQGVKSADFFIVITAIAILTMFVGNFLAIRQQNIKRLLGYSSITNMGFILIILLIGGSRGVQAGIFYLITYFIATIGAFGVLSVLSTRAEDIEKRSEIKGLYWKRPWLAGFFTLSLFSLAGLPLTMGFIGKFYVIFEGVKSGLFLLIFVMIVSSLISLYYYLRVVGALFAKQKPEINNETQLPTISYSGGLALTLISAIILFLGVFPGWLLEIIIKWIVL